MFLVLFLGFLSDFGKENIGSPQEKQPDAWQELCLFGYLVWVFYLATFSQLCSAHVSIRPLGLTIYNTVLRHIWGPCSYIAVLTHSIFRLAPS